MNYTYEQICQLAERVFSNLQQSDFNTIYTYHKVYRKRIETYGLFKKKREVGEWVTEQEKIASIYELRRSVYKQVEFGLHGVDVRINVYGISDTGKLIKISLEETVNNENDIPEKYTITDISEDMMQLFNYQFVDWEHTTNQFREWGVGSVHLPMERDKDNLQSSPYRVEGLRPNRLFIGKNEGIYNTLIQAFVEICNGRIKRDR